MITIDKVVIENFQSHENTVINFSKGLNVIVGPSDQGKSAVLRAIKWVLYNEPRGMDFIRQGSSTVRVSIQLNNGWTVIRERSKSRNRYIMVGDDGQQTIFEGFGNEVPEEVIKAHGIPRVVLDNDISAILNISDQLEGPFLLSETPSVRAKAIGRLTGLHIIDKAIRDSIVDLRRENQTTERLKADLKQLENHLLQYKELEAVKVRLETSEILLKKLEDLLLRKSKLEECRKNLTQLLDEGALLHKRLIKLDRLVECEMIIRNCESLIGKQKLIQHYRNSYVNTEDEIQKAFNIFEKTRFIRECSEKLNEAIVLKDRVDKLNVILSQLRSLSDEISKQERILSKTAKLDEIDTLYREVTEKINKQIALNQVYVRFTKLEREMQSAKLQLKGSENIFNCEASVEALTEKVKRCARLEELKNQYSGIIGNLEEGRKFLGNNQAEVRNLTKHYAGLLKRIGKCPVCNSSISESKVNEVIRHYEEAHQ